MQKNKFNGERVKNARLYRGYTLTDISKETDISKQSLSLYENNKNIPELEKVLRLSQVLNFPYDFFFQKEEFNVKTDATYFRSLLSTNKKDRISQSIKLEFISKIFMVLSEYITFPALNLPEIEFQGGNTFYTFEDDEEENQMEIIADSIRKYWNLDSGPIGDLRHILESNGIMVTSFETDSEKIDAFSQRTIINNNEIFLIVIAKYSQSVARARFDMAHEMAHILLHPWSEDLELITKEEFKARERQANMLASAFLLPAESFGKDISLYPTNVAYYRHLKNKWNVSIQAMIYRTHQLNIITTNQYQYLMRQVSKNEWRMNEPDDRPFILNNNLLQSAIDMLLHNNVLSGDEIVNELKLRGLSMHKTEIEQLLNLESGTLKTIKTYTPNIIELKK